jgi:maltose alpha-D-glucosyltransferase/alpha-amylase
MTQFDNGFSTLDNSSDWYKDAIIYEVHVRAFADSNGDGIGDFAGLTERLDYLQDLGVTAIWLLPFYPSPLRDDGYDIADYNEVNPTYGTIQDVRTFIREAHRRGLRVITELVCNHTSDQHPWFQRARKAKPGSSNRDFYVWSDTPDKYKDARIIFKDFETSNWTWDSVAGAYYWHRFYSHQPDLNFDNPQVQRAVFKAMDFWFDMGVDGLRLDAIPYLYEREGTNCENLPETHEFLKKLRRHVDNKFKHRMFLAEANQWPEDSASYFGEGDECQMAFHFPVMPRLFMSIHMEDRFPIIEILRQTPAIPDNCQWAIFLRNHDELTLEMVTDEERDYMYRVYAQDRQARINLGIRRRLAPLLGNHRRKIELMNGLLFSLPGTPVLYYGDEIGMGDNIYLGDRNGVRTPMQWSADRNAGFSRANPQRLFLPVIIDPEYHYETVNVEAHQANPHSLLWWMKRLIALRRRYKAFGHGSIEFLQPDNRKVLVFVRRYQNETILIIANLSRFVQAVEIDLSEFKGMMPVEMFGRIEFPPIGELPYFITLGPHSFYWFTIEPVRSENHIASPGGMPEELALIEAGGSWEDFLTGNGRTRLMTLLPDYMRHRRWFGGKARRIKSVSIVDSMPVPFAGGTAFLTMLQVTYTEGTAQTYALPLAFAEGERATMITHDTPHAVIARLNLTPGQPAAKKSRSRSSGNGDEDMPPEAGQVRSGIIYDPLIDRDFTVALFELMAGRKKLRGGNGSLVASTTRSFRSLRGTGQEPLEPAVVRVEQSNSSVIYGRKMIMKLFRKLDTGVNPDLEIGRFLSEKNRFPHTPPVAGMLEYQPTPRKLSNEQPEPITLAILQGFVENEGDAWAYTLDMLDNFYEHALTSEGEIDGNWIMGGEEPAADETGTRMELHDQLAAIQVSTGTLLDLCSREIPVAAHAMIGSYLESARLIGQRTAEMHLALASDAENPAFAPEAFSTLYQRSVYQSMRTMTTDIFQTMRKQQKKLSEASRDDVQRLLDLEGDILQRFRLINEAKIDAVRTRTHGDYHLGQVLYTGKDFLIIDFEGEPVRTLSERRIKRSPLRDVAGMLRSFHYAAYAVQRRLLGGALRPEDQETLDGWARFWHLWVSATFLKAYLETSGKAAFIPQQRRHLQILLDVYLLEKSIYELGYELNNRPDWLAIPMQGVFQLIGASGATGVAVHNQS